MRPALIPVVALPCGQGPAIGRADKIPDSDDKKEDTGESKPDHMKAIPTSRSFDDALKAAPEPGFQWQPFGYLRLQYLAVQNDPNVAFVGRDDGFELQIARVGVHGTWGDKAEFLVSIDGAVDERAQINVPEGKLRVGLRD